MKKITIFVLLIFSLTACSLFDFLNKDVNSGDGGETVQILPQISGKIVDFINECPLDGICAYIVETESGELITVIWAEGDSPDCANDPFSADVEPFDALNKQVEVSGSLVDASTISVCGEESYYIRFAEETVSNQDDAQASRQLTGEVIEFISDCAFDGNCAYVVETESGELITVIWAEGSSPICQNDPFQGGDSDIQVGDSIDSLGRVIDASTTSACGDPSYYIRKTN